MPQDVAINATEIEGLLRRDGACWCVTQALALLTGLEVLSPEDVQASGPATG